MTAKEFARSHLPIFYLPHGRVCSIVGYLPEVPCCGLRVSEPLVGPVLESVLSLAAFEAGVLLAPD